MAGIEIAKMGDKYGANSFTTGFNPSPRYSMSLEDEARKCPEAVINRLMNQGKWDTAEIIMDKYL